MVCVGQPAAGYQNVRRILMKPDAIADLELFNEKADVLLHSSFSEKLLRNQSAFLFSWSEGQAPESVLIGAEGESVDAAFLTLRMFMQNNDRISIGNIAKIYESEFDISPFRQEFESTRSLINTYLDSKNGIDFFGKQYTNKETIELLLYGSKGHSNRAKESELKGLMLDPIVSNLFLHMVNVAAANLVKGISAISDINKKALLGLHNASR